MQLKSLRLTSFKNYESQSLDLATRLNAFVGHNGAGKTNLLEAVYYLCMGKSYDSRQDSYSMRHGGDFFRLEGQFADPDHRIVLKAKQRQRKVIERDGRAYERLAEHVGLLPVVLIVPDDVRLVHEGSEFRRRLLDNSLSQSDADYLRHLMTYNQLLKQRNALLKQEGGDLGLLDVYDQQMAAPAAFLHEKRAAFTAPFKTLLQSAHGLISGGQQEQVDLRYKSQLSETAWLDLMQERRDKDRILQRTTGGMHRDDLIFEQGGHPLKRVASQGQLKSFVLALKLAQYHLLREQTGRYPLLLLDDIFDKLDQNRVGQLLSLLLGGDYGQIFITDTDMDRVAHLVGTQDFVETEHAASWKLFEVVNGQVEESYI